MKTWFRTDANVISCVGYFGTLHYTLQKMCQHIDPCSSIFDLVGTSGLFNDDREQVLILIVCVIKINEPYSSITNPSFHG